MSWMEISLGSALHVKHGFAFKGEHFASEGELVVLTPGNFNEEGGFRARPGRDRYYTGDIPRGYVLEEGALIVAMTEQGPGLLGSSALIPEGNRYLHNQRLGLVGITDSSVLDIGFTYYLFNTRAVRGQLSGSATGTKVRHTAPERIYRVKVTVPDVPSQQRIASTLRAYDDLIANNARRVELLERSARVLFDEWFVRLRYPGHEHEKVVKGVPEGWEQKSIKELTSFVSRGITPRYDDEAVGIVINQKCIRNGRLSLEPARHQSKEPPKNKLVCRNDVLINSTGEGTLGRIAQVHQDIDLCTVDSHVTIVRPNGSINPLYFGLAAARYQDFFSSQGRGATNQSELSRSTIENVELLVPKPELQSAFSDIAAPNYQQASLLTKQSEGAVRARDLLLPRLMDGRVSI